MFHQWRDEISEVLFIILRRWWHYQRHEAGQSSGVETRTRFYEIQSLLRTFQANDAPHFVAEVQFPIVKLLR
jgi:hypothetical protein